MNIFLRFILFLFIVSSLSGCATMIRGTSQDIPIKSDPSGAQVRINGLPKGFTPITVPISRRSDEPLISLEYDGYKKWELSLNKTHAPWAMLNLIVGPFAWFGVIPDLINQANYTFEPEELNIKLEKISTSKSSEEKTPENKIQKGILHEKRE